MMIPHELTTLLLAFRDANFHPRPSLTILVFPSHMCPKISALLLRDWNWEGLCTVEHEQATCKRLINGDGLGKVTIKKGEVAGWETERMTQRYICVF